jgi:hypothetical protein
MVVESPGKTGFIFGVLGVMNPLIRRVLVAPPEDRIHFSSHPHLHTQLTLTLTTQPDPTKSFNSL